jgi:hypothetical protein
VIVHLVDLIVLDSSESQRSIPLVVDLVELKSHRRVSRARTLLILSSSSPIVGESVGLDHQDFAERSFRRVVRLVDLIVSLILRNLNVQFR